MGSDSGAGDRGARNQEPRPRILGGRDLPQSGRETVRRRQRTTSPRNSSFSPALRSGSRWRRSVAKSSASRESSKPDRLFEMLESSASSLDRAREVERRFLWFIDDMLYRADTESLEQIYRSRFRFLYAFAGSVARSPEKRRHDPVVIDPGAMEQAPAGLQTGGFPPPIARHDHRHDRVLRRLRRSWPTRSAAISTGRSRSPIRPVFLDSLTDPGWIAHAAGILGLWIALWWCYFAVGWGLLGATIGKWVFGLRIVDHRGPISHRSVAGISPPRRLLGEFGHPRDGTPPHHPAPRSPGAARCPRRDVGRPSPQGNQDAAAERRGSGCRGRRRTILNFEFLNF